MAEGAEKGYETQDFRARALGWFTIGLAALAVFTLLAMAGLLRLLGGGEVEMAVKAPPPGELAPGRDLRSATPGPKLQRSPAREMRQMRALEDAQLNDYGWVDRQRGIAAIPIQRAMELLVQRRLTLDSGEKGTEHSDKEQK